MKKWKHITFEQRKIISSGIAHNMKVKNIAELISVDPTGISREVKRNRSIVEHIKQNNNCCPNLQRWPYVCTNCKNRYTKNVHLINSFIMLKMHKILPIII